MTEALGIDGLDGRTHTLVGSTMGPWEVMIGGGPDQFVLTATANDGRRAANALTAATVGDTDDDDDDDETVDLTVGGQAVDYPRQYVLTRAEVDVAVSDILAGRFPEERWEVIG